MTNFFHVNRLLRNNEFVNPISLPENQDEALYEILRVIDRVPVFWKEHFERLVHSAELAGISLSMDKEQFSIRLKKLIRKVGFKLGNIKILVVREQDKEQFYFYFITHNYPTRTDYKSGVKLGLFKAERLQPQAKVIQQELRAQVDQMILEGKLYEVLLVNRHGNITEGSRSNVFFIRGETFKTPPAKQVLRGITRAKVIECIRQLNFELEEETISQKDLKTFDAAFLTGTSPKVLPISEINDIHFRQVAPAVKKIMNSYNEMIRKEVAENRNFFCS